MKKMRSRAQLIGALAMLSLSAPAPAQQPARPDRWVVDWGDHYCSLVREVGEASFMVRVTPGSNSAELVILPRQQSVFPERYSRVRIDLKPSGERFNSEVARLLVTRAGQKVIQTDGIEGFLERFAGSSAIELRAGPIRLDATYPAAQQAVAAVKTCENDAPVQWGIDPAAHASLRSLPEMVGNGPILRSEDYPSQAWRAEQFGTVVMRITIDVEGRVTDCTVLVPSGTPILDEVSCRAFRERARYRPAIGADGRPVEAKIMRRVNFRLPGPV